MITQQQLAQLADQVSPMHVIVDADGQILSAGPTLKKLRPDEEWVGQAFFDFFEVSRPRWVHSFQDLLSTAGSKLHMNMRGEPSTGIKGMLAPLPNCGGAFINLSFGISVLEAVQDYDLTSADFAPTDLTIEMLYLVEAKSAAMEASRQLNTRLQGAKIAAEEQAFTDTLTGLKNRRAMDHVLGRLLKSGRDFALMHVDLDFFKQVNDTMGHAAGDAVLQHVAQVMVECTRQTDTTVRVGGDEFVLILDDLTDRKMLRKIAERLIARLEEPIPFEDKLCHISGSAGTSLSTAFEKPDIATMLHQADVALYFAKNAGRAQHFFYSPEMEEEGATGASVSERPKVAE
ncbi:GGDEF domain-containing protein [Epibacterium ulvae]|uniref:guanylate cyclase n=1 Tax=Epibacterium ulvae TaxID=1156985 RepID=A0A1G5R4X1_9RHOB|nr:GGDEF domain-containing protein [Epibacterium ulvae]SCZ69006.1 diguanylate cyclase (GGDEF) domain-containing protein [Epibacterium ulvae]